MKVEIAINGLDVKFLVITTTFKIDQRPKNNRGRGWFIHITSSSSFRLQTFLRTECPPSSNLAEMKPRSFF